MKKRIYLSILSLLCICSLRGQTLQEQAALTSVLLEEKNDSLYIELDIHVHGGSLHKDRSLTLIPELAVPDGADSYTFPHVLINGKRKGQLYRRRLSFRQREVMENPPFIRLDLYKQTDTTLLYRHAVPYAYWMDTAALRVHQVFVACANKERTYTIENRARVKIQPYIPYQPLVHINYIEPAIEDKQRTMMGEAYLDFEAGKSVILADFRRNPVELGKILASIRQIADDPDVGINRIEITGYASPEGSWRTNETLSRNRASALKEFIRRQFPIADNLFAVDAVAEDWVTLRRIVEENSGVNHPVLSATEQARILTIIDSEEAPDRKEARLRALGSTWQTLLTGYFPPLRRVKYQITYTVKDYSTEPIEVLLEKEPEQLNAYELFRVAEQYPRDSEDWHQKMEQTVKLHPESVEVNINAAASHLVQGEPDKAREYLDKVGDDPRASNNWGAYYLMTGDAGKAEAYFRNVISADPDGALNNLMEVEKVKEDQERQRTRGRREAKK